MPVYHEWKKRRSEEELSKIASTSLYLIDRPLLLHESTNGDHSTVCDCGCNSRNARVVERREHIQVLINPLTGVRRVRSQVNDKATFDDLASRAKRIWLPRRCSHKQLEAIGCGARILALFGGIRFGKTTEAGEETVDQWLLHGGPGAQIWWVAPTQEKTNIGLNKLARGELIGKGDQQRRIDPLIPDALISHLPTSVKSDKNYIELIDGTRIWLKYASRDGGNLKGEAPIFVVMDEGCEVRDESNYKQVLDRLMESRGRLFISTTPKAGHYFKERIYIAGQPASDWDGKSQIAWIHATAYDNPWLTSEQIRELEEQYADDRQAFRREVLGEWVGDGPLLWAHFDEARHVVDFDSYRASEWPGLVNATKYAVQRLFRKDDVRAYGGMDFNINPMSFAAKQVVVPAGMNPEDPANWIDAQFDEVVERCQTIHGFADLLNGRGFEGSDAVCDPSGAQYSSYRSSHGVDVSSTHTKELRKAGFNVRACHITDSGSPKQPPVLDRCNVNHKLLRETVVAPDGTVWPRKLIHRRCKKTIDSYRTQESDEYGKPAKEPGTVSDQRSGPIDADTYATWAVFKYEYQKAPKISF